MKKVFIDNDILLDYFLQREQFVEAAESLFGYIQAKRIRGLVSMTSFSNFYYFIAKYRSKGTALNYLRLLSKFVSFVDVKASFVTPILYESKFKDLEDALQHSAALDAKADVILTRNIKDYLRSKIPVMTARDFLEMFS